jgi:hypothetical protein
MDPLAFLSVAFGLLNFADHPRVHFYPPRNVLYVRSFTLTLKKNKKTPRHRQPKCLLAKPM